MNRAARAVMPATYVSLVGSRHRGGPDAAVLCQIAETGSHRRTASRRTNRRPQAKIQSPERISLHTRQQPGARAPAWATGTESGFRETAERTAALRLAVPAEQEL